MSATFPDPKTYDFPEWALYGDYFYKANDIISFGDELTAENVREAYRKGIFPWHIDGIPLPLRVGRPGPLARKKTQGDERAARGGPP